LSHNGFIDEFEAAAKFGLIPDITMTIPADRNWFALPRVTRAAMVASLMFGSIANAITGYDSQEYWRKKNEKKQR